MSIVTVVLGLSLLYCAWAYIKRLMKPAQFPPGPAGLVSMLVLTKQRNTFLSETMLELTETYGPVVGLVLFHRKFVCISGHAAVVDALGNPFLSGRPHSFDFNLRTKGKRRGVLMTDGQLWKEQRRFTLRHLRDLGFGKSCLEGIMLDEISELVIDIGHTIDSSVDGNIYLDDVFTTSVINILWVMVANTRFARGDPRMDHLTSCMNGFIRNSNGGPSMLTFWPFLRYIAPRLSGYDNLIQHVGPLRAYIEGLVAEHKLSRQADAPRDFIDVYLEVMEKQKDELDSFFNEEQLLGIIFDIFIAGSETTSHTLGFALLYMIFHPDVQSKVQTEIDETLQGRQPSLADRMRLPYTEATLHEIQRLGMVAPITVPHVAEQDTSCQGYHIPKGTVAFINLWSAHLDKEAWPNPAKFLPERHLDEQGNFRKPENMITFGLGKRSCIGESLARTSLFLFFTSIMQHFRFEFPKSTKTSDPHTPIDYALQPSLEPISGLTLAPRSCLACVTKRLTTS